MFTNHIFDMYKQDLVLNSLQRICQKTQSHQTKLKLYFIKITLVYKNKFLVWGKNEDRYFLLIWVCWIKIYK